LHRLLVELRVVVFLGGSLGRLLLREPDHGRVFVHFNRFDFAEYLEGLFQLVCFNELWQVANLDFEARVVGAGCLVVVAGQVVALLDFKSFFVV
jgi:hypothetical protein